MMHCIAGFGLWVVWSPPFVKGGADFNMTAWWLVLHGVIDADQWWRVPHVPRVPGGGWRWRVGVAAARCSLLAARRCCWLLADARCRARAARRWLDAG